MNPTKLTALSTGKTIATVDTVCLVELQKVLEKSGDNYHVLILKDSAIDDLGDLTCKPEVIEGLKDAIGDAESLKIGYQALKPEAKWRIEGSVRDRSNAAIPGLLILAYDKDTAKRDDFLGCTFTDDEGFFELGYEESDFKSVTAFIDFEGNPDLYLEVTDIESGSSKKTATKGEAKKKEHFELKVDFKSPTRMVRPIVGYYFIEEDKLEEEIESLKEAIKADPEDATSHFLLGLCFIEMIKSDLHRSEWMVPEIRSDDDVLALAAIQELDTAVTLDEDLKEEAYNYRKYVQELQDLAL